MAKDKVEKYSKEALVKNFKEDALLVSALLDGTKEYSVQEVEKAIGKWKGEQIK